MKNQKVATHHKQDDPTNEHPQSRESASEWQREMAMNHTTTR